MESLFWVEYTKTNIHGWGTGLVYVSAPFTAKGLVDMDTLHAMILDTNTTVKKVLSIDARDVTEVYVGTEESELVKDAIRRSTPPDK